MMEKFDVIVAGAGPNGLAMALALGGKTVRRPLKVAVVDKSDPRQSKDARSSALTAATQQMLKQLDAYGTIAPEAEAMRRISVSDGGSASLLNFLVEEGQSPAVIVENRFIMQGVMAALEASSAITLKTGNAISAFHFGPGLAQVTLADGASLKAPLIIGADGRASPSREAAGITLNGWPYAQSAVTFSIAHEHPHHGEALEKFHAHGVFAFLPLAHNRASIVWTEAHDEANRLAALDEAEFIAALHAKCGLDLGVMKLDTPRQVYPLSLQVAETFVGPRLALIGDAAHLIHPLAGLGLNLGFKDSAALADCVHEAAALGQDIGGDAVLQAYMRWRRFDTIATAALMDGMSRLFVNDQPALKFLRQMGLRMVDKLPFAKAALASEAAGTRGALPRLMMGLSV